jgi:hypothetical protein
MQFSRESTPVELRVPIAAPQLFGEVDLIIGGNTGNPATRTRKPETPLDLLCHAATTTGLEPKLLCYRFHPSVRDTVGSKFALLFVPCAQID